MRSEYEWERGGRDENNDDDDEDDNGEENGRKIISETCKHDESGGRIAPFYEGWTM